MAGAARLIAEVLAAHGFEVHACGNAKDALERLTCGAPCDVLFTDINLPDGVDGGKLAELARQLHPQLRVVYASGSVSKMEQFMMPGSSFVPKPYDPERVCAMLEKFVEQPRH